MTTEILPATTQGTDEKRQVALLKAVGLDRVGPEQREIALAIASRYDLDLLLGHLVLVDGKPYVTHRGLLHVAHRSGLFDGVEVSEPRLEAGFWRCTATVWRKDMARGFTIPGRYPEKGRNASYGPEMSIARAECLALRRAFDVAAPVAEEKWAEDAEAAVAEPVRGKTLAETARLRAESLSAAIADTQPAQDAPQQPEEAAAPADTAERRPTSPRHRPWRWTRTTQPVEATVAAVCDHKAVDGLMAGSVCELAATHRGAHKSAEGSWPR